MRKRVPPSRVLRTTLPVKPSVTTTSTRSDRTSRPSTLPMNLPDVRRHPGSASRAWVSLTRADPLPGSSPIDSRPTRGSSSLNRSAAYTAPIWANCTSQAGGAVGVGPAVEQDGGDGAGDRDHGGDGRPGHALDPSHAQEGAGHGRPGVARAHHRRRPPVADRLRRPHDRRVLLAAHAPRRVLVHVDDLARLQHLHAPRVAHGLAPADQEDGDAELLRRLAGAGDDLEGALVGAHHVDRDGEEDGGRARRVDALGGAVRAGHAGRRIGRTSRRRWLDGRRTTRSWGRRRGVS